MYLALRIHRIPLTGELRFALKRKGYPGAPAVVQNTEYSAGTHVLESEQLQFLDFDLHASNARELMVSSSAPGGTIYAPAAASPVRR